MANLRVLVIDDAKFIRDRVSAAVRSEFPQFEVDEAENGRDAQRQMELKRYDLLLCDWEMPEMSGLELLQWVRANEAQRDAWFLMVTSRGERDFVLKAVEAGVNDYIGKPFSNEQLAAKINKVLDKMRAGKTGETAKVRAASKPAVKPPVAKPEPAKTMAKPKGLAQLRVSSGTYRCAIKDLNLQEVLVVIKNEHKTLPTVLEQVVVDIEQLDGSSVARINGFIHTVQAVDKRMDSHFINVHVRFVDDDPVKLEQLANYIASVR